MKALFVCCTDMDGKSRLVFPFKKNALSVSSKAESLGIHKLGQGSSTFFVNGSNVLIQCYR